MSTLSFQQALVAVCAVVGHVTASPTARAEGDSSGFALPVAGSGASFSLKQVQNKNRMSFDAPSALIQAHAKYGSTLPPQLEKAVEVNPELNRKFKNMLKKGSGGGETASVPAYPAPFYESEYVIPVQLGTPAQTVHLNLDTGSSDLWCFSTDTYGPAVNGQSLYRPDDSKTSKRLEGHSWSVRYGDGAGASGIVYKDRVQIGDTHFDHQAIQSAVQVSYDIASDPFSSGILGLAQNGANTVRPNQQSTYIENIRDKLALPIFTANLQKGKPGNYDFGYINKSSYTGSIHYTPIDDWSPFWKITPTGYQVGKDGPFVSGEWPSIVDTGTTLLLAPQHIVDDYYADVDGAGIDPETGMIVFSCEADLPQFTLAIDSYRGVVAGHFMNYGSANRTHCYGGVQTARGIGFGVIGDVVLKAQYVVFDLQSQMVGFANKDTDEPSK